MKKKRSRSGLCIVAFALTLALTLALSAGACAAGEEIKTPEEAQKAALEQIGIWKDMGLLNPDVCFEGDADDIVEFEETVGGERWFGRLFTHGYDVRWYCNRSGSPKYGCNLRVDALTGTITMATIDAVADENAEPVREMKMEYPVDPKNPEAEPETKTWYFYDNYTDIFPADMTVDRFCTLLAEYWGFSGYTLAETNDAEYGTHFEPIDGSTLLKDLNGDSRDNYYLTVFFDGDQESAPMYIELHQFPGYVSLTLGTGHAVG